MLKLNTIDTIDTVDRLEKERRETNMKTVLKIECSEVFKLTSIVSNKAQIEHY